MVRFKVSYGVCRGPTWKVSIPIWFDLKDYLSVYNSEYIAVSIPIWFDLKTYTLGTTSGGLGFNSYMVRFKAMVSCLFTSVMRCFNSYMVRFKASGATMYVIVSLFQFLYGSI